MADAEKSPKLSCGAVVLTGILAVGVIAALQWREQKPTWEATAAAAIAAVAVFLTMRCVQGFFWGLAAALCLTFHPCWKDPTESIHEWETPAGALVLAAAAGGAIAWRLTFHPRFAWRAWPLLLGMLTVGTSLAWKADQHLGLLALTLVVTALGTAAVFAGRQRLRGTEAAPSRLNVAAAVVGGIALAPASLLAYRFFDRSLSFADGWWPLVRDSFPDDLTWSTRAFEMTQLERWCRPLPWVVLPLLGLATILTLRRGWKQWTGATVPMAWFLTLCAVVMSAALLFMPQPAGPGLSIVLTALAVLLAVFAVADLLQCTFDRLVLRPPEERDAAKAVATSV
jgi:hypothetical protein